ncbi:MAG TPA: hypothetical protein VFQ88_12700 [Nevskiaceae bacterium]|nr:hypothetical protein [Nevskiaceae bacterium]
MTISTHPLGWRITAACLAACFAWAPGWVLAATTATGVAAAPPVAMPSPLAPQVQTLKNQTIDVERQARRAAADFQTPSYGRAVLYLGVDAPDLVVQQVRVQVDGQPAIVHDYTRRSAVALIRKGLALLGDTLAAPGAHTVKAQIRYRVGDGKAKDAKGAKGAPLMLERQFEVSSDGQVGHWELEVYSEGFHHTPQLRLVEWVPHT